MPNENDKITRENYEEQKRQIIENFQKNIEELRIDVQEKLNRNNENIISFLNEEKQLKKTIYENSKSDKIVPNKRKKIIINKKYMAIGMATLLLVGCSVATKEAYKNWINEYKVLNQEIEQFNNNIMKPNTCYNIVDEETNDETMDETNGVKVVHWHKLNDIFMEAKNIYDDPIIPFYLVFESLDYDCVRNKMDSFIYNYNDVYGTNYEDLEDFLTKNNFSSIEECRLYVNDKLKAEKEENLNGSRSSNLGR